MSTIKAFITNHAVATYFALTFVISWGGVLAVAGPKIPTTKEEFEQLLPMIVVMMLAGPSIGGILLTAIVYGKTVFASFAPGYKSALIQTSYLFFDASSAARSSSDTRASISSSSIALAAWLNTLSAARTLVDGGVPGSTIVFNSVDTAAPVACCSLAIDCE